MTAVSGSGHVVVVSSLVWPVKSTQKKTREARQTARNRTGEGQLGVCDGRCGQTRRQNGGDRRLPARETAGVTSGWQRNRGGGVGEVEEGQGADVGNGKRV